MPAQKPNPGLLANALQLPSGQRHARLRAIGFDFGAPWIAALRECITEHPDTHVRANAAPLLAGEDNPLLSQRAHNDPAPEVRSAALRSITDVDLRAATAADLAEHDTDVRLLARDVAAHLAALPAHRRATIRPTSPRPTTAGRPA